MSDKERVISHIARLFEELYFSCSNAADVQLNGREKVAARKIAKALADLEKDPDVGVLLEHGDSQD